MTWQTILLKNETVPVDQVAGSVEYQTYSTWTTQYTLNGMIANSVETLVLVTTPTKASQSTTSTTSEKSENREKLQKKATRGNRHLKPGFRIIINITDYISLYIIKYTVQISPLLLFVGK